MSDKWLEETIHGIKDDCKEIKKHVQKTNGRVTRLEKVSIALVAALVGVASGSFQALAEAIFKVIL